MLYREMGKTGELVSVLGFGCMRLPIIDGKNSIINEKKAVEMIEYAVEHGINYFDTAYPYHGSMEGGGASEPFLKKALHNHRNGIKIATKSPTWLINEYSDFEKYLDIQLERLGTDHIDFYLLHTLNRRLWAAAKKADYAKFLDNAIKSGKIKHAGFSFHDNALLFKEIVDSYDWEFCQIQHNYIDENYQAGKEGLDYAAKKGLGIVIMEPLRGGSLAKNLPDEVLNVLKKANPERSAADWALSWLWNNGDISIVLSGMTTMEQLEENIKIAENGLPDSMTEEEVNAINIAKKMYRDKLKVNCTACGYCMPCPVGVDIPGSFEKYNDYYLFDSESVRNSSIWRYNYHQSGEKKASNCIECGRCEEHCPQNIPIRKMLKEVVKTFEK